MIDLHHHQRLNQIPIHEVAHPRPASLHLKAAAPGGVIGVDLVTQRRHAVLLENTRRSIFWSRTSPSPLRTRAHRAEAGEQRGRHRSSTLLRRASLPIWFSADRNTSTMLGMNAGLESQL